jgi:Family of unknown function (DUF5681)
MTWVKGQSGNPLGRPHSEKIISDQIRIVVNEIDPVTKIRKARLLADKLVDFALDGHGWAFAQVMDRLEGKPIQETNVNVTRRLVDELTDDEINRRIADFIGRGAASTIEGSCEEATDQEEPDGVVPVLRIRAG